MHVWARIKLPLAARGFRRGDRSALQSLTLAGGCELNLTRPYA